MSFQLKNNLLCQQIILHGMDVLQPNEGVLYVQKGDKCSSVIFSTTFSPKRQCTFSVQTGKGGLYLLNNSSLVYIGNLFLKPNKLHTFNIVYKDSSWKIYSDSSYSDNNIVIEWTTFFNSKVTGAPPLSARKYAIFINGIYNSLLTHTTMFKEAVVNETAKALSTSLLPGIVTSSVYSKYPTLKNVDKTTVEAFATSYLNTLPIPEEAVSATYIIPSPHSQTQWYGSNPVLPNWNSTNISYLANTYTDATHDPLSGMPADSTDLLKVVRTSATNEVAYHFANTPPPAHMINIACTMLSDREFSPVEMAKILSVLSIGIADAGIYAWTAKYTHWGARPFQYLSGYKALITTPNFPGYISGHSTFSGSWDKLLGMLVPSLRNISEYIADLSGISRLYGGIHFSDDNTTGLSAGRSIGDSVYKELMTEINNTQAFL